MKFTLAVIAAFGVGVAGAGGLSQFSAAAPPAPEIVAKAAAVVAPVAAPGAPTIDPGAAVATMAAATAALGLAASRPAATLPSINPVATYSDIQKRLAAGRAQVPLLPKARIPMTTIRFVAPSRGAFRRGR